MEIFALVAAPPTEFGIGLNCLYGCGYRVGFAMSIVLANSAVTHFCYHPHSPSDFDNIVEKGGDKCKMSPQECLCCNYSGHIVRVLIHFYKTNVFKGCLDLV